MGCRTGVKHARVSGVYSGYCFSACASRGDGIRIPHKREKLTRNLDTTVLTTRGQGPRRMRQYTLLIRGKVEGVPRRKPFDSQSHGDNSGFCCLRLLIACDPSACVVRQSAGPQHTKHCQKRGSLVLVYPQRTPLCLARHPLPWHSVKACDDTEMDIRLICFMLCTTHTPLPPPSMGPRKPSIRATTADHFPTKDEMPCHVMCAFTARTRNTRPRSTTAPP